MKTKTLLIPTLSTLFLSTLVLANAVAAEDVSLETTPEPILVEDPTLSEDIVAVTESETEDTTNVIEGEETAVGPTRAVSDPTAPSDTVTILHTNDIHGRIEGSRGVIGVAKLATVVEETRAQGTTLVLDAGDAFQGMPISNSSKGEDLAAIMNQIGYDAMAVGNHEFDFGLDQAKKYTELLNFPLLSSNVYVDGARIFQASTIIDKDTTVEGDEFVVIGVTTPETATKTHPKNILGVTFTDPVTEVNAVIAQIEAKAAAEGKTYNRYIVLAHLGVDSTTPVEWQGSTLAEALAANTSLAGKTVILIDGHSHTVLNASHGENVVYNQTGNYLNNIGRITLNSTGVLSAAVISETDTAAVVPNEAIAAKVAEIKERYEAQNAEVIVAANTVELNGDRSNVRVRETNQGNAIADAMWAYGQTGFSKKTNLAVMNGGGIRATLPAGQDVTVGDVISVLPFGNSISQIEVTGQNILDMFTKSLGSEHQKDADGNPILDEKTGLPLLEASGGFLHVAGVNVYYDPRIPAEDRVLLVEIYDHETETFEILDLEKVYYLATNDFLAAGGDGYTMLGGAREEGPSLDSVYAEYLANADLTAYSEINPNERLVAFDVTTDTDGDGHFDIIEYVEGTNLEDPNDYPGKVTPEDKTDKPADQDKKETKQDKLQSTTPASPALKKSASLPETGSVDSILASLAGFTLLSYGFYGQLKKSKKN